MPRSEDLAQFADAFEAASRAVRETARAREAVEKEIDETTGRLAQLAAGRPLATADRIAEARARRETAWRPLRAAIFGAPEAPPQASLAAHVAEFERLKGEADRLADDAIEDAARLAEHRLETQRLDEQTRRLRFGAGRRSARGGDVRGNRCRVGGSFGSRSASVLVRRRGCRNGPAASSNCMKTRDKLAARRTELEAREAELARLEPGCAR